MMCREAGPGGWYDAVQAHQFPACYGARFPNWCFSSAQTRFKFGRVGTKANRSFSIVCRRCRAHLFMSLAYQSTVRAAINEQNARLMRFLRLDGPPASSSAASDTSSTRASTTYSPLLDQVVASRHN